ncbi:RecQ family ATP-dependent DNA helicase [Frondihabitans cladoniiphilus]|uniref:ATP-dependent DNA helicase RecQ n=1 Tax=Frondihabitans cladoniiphilus TaxID=715785 RepID=A0ABP8VV51_9MICO
MTTRTAIDTTAADVYGWRELRPGQPEAISALLDGRDVLALMPTGFGKSAIYQVAGALLDGPTLVVSPLIALQTDQVDGLERHARAPRAAAINSARGASANEETWRAFGAGEIEFLFLSPEQLASDEVVDRLRTSGVSLVVVDEAHCVSAWGHDFRPDYLHLGSVIERLGHPPVLALTATGAGPVRDEIVERLGMRDPLVVGHGFDRPNIDLQVVRHEEEKEKEGAVVAEIVGQARPGLLYVATRAATTRYADALRAEGVQAAAYHAGLPAAERDRVHERFLSGEIAVVVATSAFGMGIDKSDVRFVVHADVPDSLDAYYQEIGRAGRDGEPAVATLHYRTEDLGLRTFFASGLPSKTELGRVFTVVASAETPIRRSVLAKHVDLKPRHLGRLVDLLIEASALTEGRSGVHAADGMKARDAAARALEVAASRERVEKSRLAMMQAYAETSGCRRQHLLAYFGEELAEPCGHCDTCLSGSAFAVDDDAGSADAGATDADSTADSAFRADESVRHREWGHGTVMSVESDRVTVFFESEGYKVLSLEAVRDGKLLLASS